MHAPAAVFDAAAGDYDFDDHHAVVADELVAGIPSAGSPALIIDVATGTGAAAYSALRHLAPERIIAIDFSLRMLDRARERATRHDPEGRIEWRAAPAVPLDIDDQSADVVLCASSLHFLGHAALAEWRRVLRPGGLVAFSIPVAATFAPSVSFRPLIATDLAIPGTRAEAAEIAGEAGFRRVDVQLSGASSENRPGRAFLIWAQV